MQVARAGAEGRGQDGTEKVAVSGVGRGAEGRNVAGLRTGNPKPPDALPGACSDGMEKESEKGEKEEVFHTLSTLKSNLNSHSVCLLFF